MRRPSCIDRPGVALHAVQRGPAAQFAAAGEASAYLERLRGHAARLGCPVHAYALMGNHAHLLFTPADPGGARELMHALGAGTPERDFDATPVHARRQLLACMRYIELNPVRAGLVAWPGDWRWSSYAANALGEEDALLTPHALYCALGRTPELRRARYRALFSGAAAPAAWRAERTPSPGPRAGRPR
jgi:putative transposase